MPTWWSEGAQPGDPSRRHVADGLVTSTSPGMECGGGADIQAIRVGRWQGSQWLMSRDQRLVMWGLNSRGEARQWQDSVPCPLHLIPGGRGL